jgi:hypothetical protein
MKQTTDEDQVVLAEMADLMTRQLKALHSGGSMFVYFYEADGRHTYRITKEEIVNTIAHEFTAADHQRRDVETAFTNDDTPKKDVDFTSAF